MAQFSRRLFSSVGKQYMNSVTKQYKIPSSLLELRHHGCSFRTIVVLKFFISSGIEPTIGLSACGSGFPFTWTPVRGSIAPTTWTSAKQFPGTSSNEAHPVFIEVWLRKKKLKQWTIIKAGMRKCSMCRCFSTTFDSGIVVSNFYLWILGLWQFCIHINVFCTCFWTVFSSSSQANIKHKGVNVSPWFARDIVKKTHWIDFVKFETDGLEGSPERLRVR